MAYATPEKKRENNRKYRESHREELRAYHRAKYRQDREARLAYDMFRHHGLRPEDWAALADAQDGRCYLCGDALGKKAAVDHDHACCPRLYSCSRCRRGIACMNCNIAIGHAGEDPDRLRRMADNLEAAQLAIESQKADIGEQPMLGLG